MCLFTHRHQEYWATYIYPTGIRLVDNKTDVNGINGTVEVYHNGEWRSVCDDYWTDVEADVACGQLGYLPYGKF